MKVEINPTMEPVNFCDMLEGQCGVVVGGDYDGEIVMKTYKMVVSLSNNARVWSNMTLNTNKVRLFPPGTKITLTVEV